MLPPLAEGHQGWLHASIALMGGPRLIFVLFNSGFRVLTFIAISVRTLRQVSVSELVDEVQSILVSEAPSPLQQISSSISKGPEQTSVEIEEEFRQLMSSFSKPIEPDRLFECLPTSLRPTKSDNGNDGLETDSYRTPTLIPPRVLALMNDIAQQLVQSGNQQSCYQIYSYQSTLELLFEEFETSDAEFKFPAVITRIMQSLQNNLDGKSKQYKDPALTYLFLMNNIYFMVTKVRRSEVKHILGDDWIERHHRIVQQNVDQYKNVAWAKILQTLSVQFAGSSGISSATIKERLKSFNMQFEELHAKQSQWSIPDQELRQSLRIAVAEVLLPAYQSFVQLFSILIENSKNQQKYIRYSPEAVDQLLGQFFEGQQSVEEKGNLGFGSWIFPILRRRKKTLIIK
ncbi:hypothetical protein PR202_ga24651 [Eleusine coracana subsp. coracana]|uniref:Exocyst subunit Exo70 family protein n=1 Tax=Eleusine coracana subsp. coracana TaxID=191504 RepID=A0AAV5D950_ELECO|nr:hypothetical protein PR202_ga24651 [Eleusine coracana subsp. coracana]